MTEPTIPPMVPSAPTDDELSALIKPLWLVAKPSREAQTIRSTLSCDFDDGRYRQWVSTSSQNYVWDLVDIAAQRGAVAERGRLLAALREPSAQMENCICAQTDPPLSLWACCRAAADWLEKHDA